MKKHFLFPIILIILFACQVEPESKSTLNKNPSTNKQPQPDFTEKIKQEPVKSDENWMNFQFDKVIAFATISPFERIPYNGKRIDLSDLKDTISIRLTKNQIANLDSVITGKKNKKTSGRSPADCFNPRHNIIFLKQDSVVNYILVCYECGYYRTSKPGIGGGLASFKDFFDSLGLKVFDDPNYHQKYYDSLINKRKHVR